MPLKFELGEAFPFDWGEESLVIGGILRKVIASHTKLCSSRAFFIFGYPGQSHEMLFDAHNRAFAALGGVAKRGIYDNMKTAVDKVSKGNGRIVNTRFHAMVSHYLFEADFCHVASGWEKGIVEKNVQDARRRIWIAAKQQPFSTYEYLNVWLEARCRVLWTELEHPDYAASGGVPLAVEYLQTHQRHHHHQPDLLGMEQRVGDAKLTTPLLDRLTPHCHITDTGEESYRFKHSSAQAKERIKSWEKIKRSPLKTDEEPF